MKRESCRGYPAECALPWPEKAPAHSELARPVTAWLMAAASLLCQMTNRVSLPSLICQEEKRRDLFTLCWSGEHEATPTPSLFIIY